MLTNVVKPSYFEDPSIPELEGGTSLLQTVPRRPR
jgi:hypothetical protein